MQRWLNKPLVVATSDIQAYYCLVNLLKEAGFSDFMSLLPESDLPPNAIILTTKVEGKKIARKKESNFRIISFNFNGSTKIEDLDLIVKILEHEKGKKIFEKSVTGIDPGSKYTGLALLVEDQVVYTCRRQGIEEVEKTLSKILKLVKARRRVVKLGEGWGRETKKKWVEHFKKFIKRYKNVEFYVIPEHGTTKKKSKKLGKDQAAAIEIAYRPENFHLDG